MKIVLNDEEILWLTRLTLAKVREIDRYGHGKSHNIMQNYSSFMSGLSCEYVVAKALGVEDLWLPTSEKDRFNGDVFGLEVRTSAFRDGDLIVRGNENKSRTMVFVDSYFMPSFEILGYIEIIDAIAPQYEHKTTSKGLMLYKIPRLSLRPIKELFQNVNNFIID